MTTLDQLRRALRTHAGDDFAVIATSPDGAVVFWSRGARRLYGWTEADALGRNIMELTPAVQARPKAGEIMDSLRRGEAWDGEILLRKKDGSLFRAVVTDLPLSLSGEAVAVIVGVSGPIEDKAAVVAKAESLRGGLGVG